MILSWMIRQMRCVIQLRVKLKGVRDQHNQAAEDIRESAGKTWTGEAETNTAENAADRVEEAGEQKADAIEEQGENRADALEDADDNADPTGAGASANPTTSATGQ